MNLAINGTCAKGCSFCFTKEDARLRHTLGEMSIRKVGELLDHFDVESAQDEIDLICFGRPFISNPDLVRKLQDNISLTPGDENTFYGGGEKGYIDY